MRREDRDANARDGEFVMRWCAESIGDAAPVVQIEGDPAGRALQGRVPRLRDPPLWVHDEGCSSLRVRQPSADRTGGYFLGRDSGGTTPFAR